MRRGYNKAGKSTLVLVLATAIFLTLLFIQLSAGDQNNKIEDIRLEIQEEYYVNEPVTIDINSEHYKQVDLTNMLEIWIRHSGNQYKYFGKIYFPLNFSLENKGSYEIILVNKINNQIISQEQFDLIEKKIRLETKNVENFLNIRTPFDTVREHPGLNKGSFRGQVFEINNPIPSINKIEFRGLSKTGSTNIGLDEINTPINVNNLKGVRSFAIDPTTADFKDAKVTVTAEGESLFMCKDYNFTTRTCWGSWERVRSINPGEEYTFMITPEDPLFTETNDTFDCSCSDSVTDSPGGTISCDVYCEFTIDVPVDAIAFFLDEIEYVVDLTIDSDGTAPSGSQAGYLDKDEILGNGNEVLIGSGTSATSTTLNWVKDDFDETGALAFNEDNCDNWPSHCTYYVYLESDFTFNTPGKALRDAFMEISINEITYVLNYTEPGDFAVILDNPSNNFRTNQLTNTFDYIPTSEDGIIDSCSLYTNDNGWGVQNTSISIVNGSINSLDYTFSSPGTYLWNVECDDGTDTVFAINNRTIIIDQTLPTIDLIAPADEYIETESTVIGFQYEVNDDSPIDFCSLNINGDAVTSQINPSRGVTNTINYNLQGGTYNWSVSCEDVAGNFNTSEERLITVDVEPVLNTGLWYETSSGDCNTLPCQIGLAQEIGIENSITGTITAQQTQTIVQALSPFLGGNGVEISGGGNVLFSSYFNEGDARLELLWYLYYRNENEQDQLICSNTGGSATADASSTTGTCTVPEDFYIKDAERLYYRIDLTNTHPNQIRTFDHAVDNLDSYVDIDDFFQIGFLSTSILEPVDQTLYGQGQEFNVTCEVECEFAYCLDVDVIVQTNQSGTWQNINGGDSVNLLATQSNPVNEGNLFNETINTTFNLITDTPGNPYLRCVADSKYQEEFSEVIQIIVSTTQEPVITLEYPENNSWINDEPVEFAYTPVTFSDLDYCQLYVNDVLEDTDNNPNANVQNTFSVSGLQQTRYNWSVTCEDVGGLVGNSTTFYFDIDREPPYNLTVFHPAQPEATVTSETVLFNFTVQDLRSDTMTCDLFIDGGLNQTITAFNDSLTNISVSGFDVGNYTWRLQCGDLAGNINSTDTFNLTIVDVPPVIDLISPLDETGVNETIATLSYLPQDGFGIQECRLYINNTLVDTDTNIDVNNINTFEYGINEEAYLWNVECIDSNNNAANSSQWTFYGDFTPPTIVLDNPLDSAYFPMSTVDFSYTGFDNWAPLTCTININSMPTRTTNTTSGTLVTEQITNLPDGFQTWDVMCEDIGGNTNISETRTFTINETPTIILDFPTNNSFINTTSPALLYTPVDNDGFNYCELYLNGAFETFNQTNITSGEQQNFSLTGLNEGFYNWSVLCEDAGVFSNINRTENYSFIVDVTPPNINLLDPIEDQTINTTSYTFEWLATDNLANTLTCDVYLDEELNVSGFEVDNGVVANYTIEGFVSKNYTWRVECTDLAGNMNTSALVNFTAVVPPEVELVSPENFTGGTDRNVTFSYIPSGGTGDFNSCSLLVNGQVEDTATSITAGDINSFELINLPDGRYDWNVQCTDTNSLTGQAPSDYTYFVDTEPPYLIELLNPLNNSIEVRNNVSFTFRGFDEVSPILSCDIDLTEDGSSPFRIASNIETENATNTTHHELLPDGNYSWYVECSDLAGLIEFSDEYFFEVDAPPNVTLLNPLNNTWFDTDTVELTYYPEDDFGITSCDLLLNGQVEQTDNSAVNKQNNTFELTGLAEGQYNWTVACTDNDANTFAPANWTFYVDLTNPLVTLNYPIQNELVETSTVNFNFTVTDNLAPQLSCDLYVNNTLNTSGIIVNNSEPFIQPISVFNDGLFDWNVQCFDLAGNEDTSVTEEFEVQEPPMVILGDPEDNYRNNTVNRTLFYTSFDNSGEIEECTLILNGVENITNTNIQEGVEQNFTLTSLVNGTYTWDVQCTDPSLNIGINGTPKTFHVDLEPPVITLLEPEVDETFNQNDIFFSWNATDFNESIPIVCEINITDPEGDRFVDNITGLSGSLFTHFEENLSDGEHFWNVTCMDDLGNKGTSETRRFVINQPNLNIEDDDISFNNTNPDLNERLNITANVSNIGGIGAQNVLVEFWHEHPDEGGVLIGQDTKDVPFNESVIFSTTWNITAGFNTIHVFVDPNKDIAELNKSNNNASTNISVLRSVLNEPINGSIFGFEEVDINFTLQDYTGNPINYTIFVDGNPFETGQINDNETTIRTLTLLEGRRTIIVQAEDHLGRLKNSTEIEIIIDLTPPVPQIITLNETWFNTQNPEIEILITDNLAEIINYTLFLNGTPEVTGSVLNNTLENITLTTLTEGSYELILEGVDLAGNKANSSSITIYVDVTPPNIVLNAPDNNAIFTTNDVLLNYTVFDNLAAEAVCEINLNGDVLGPFNANTGEEQTFLLEDLTEGIYNWNVSCSDEAGNNNVSETRTFNVFLPPEITLLSPPDESWSNNEENTFVYNVSDETGIEECRLYLNNNLEQTDTSVVNNELNNFTVNNMEGPYEWRVECNDNSSFNTLGVSDTWSLTVDLEPPVPVILTTNNTWFDTAPSIDFIITDNYASLIDYDLFVNNIVNKTGTVMNNTQETETLTGFNDGIYDIILQGTDLAGNKENSSMITVYQDTEAPQITLGEPLDEVEIFDTDVNFTFTPTDNLADYLMCALTLNNEQEFTGVNVTNGAEETLQLQNLSGGTYVWNVTCIDQAGNSNVSETRTFYIPIPDIAVNESEIFFSNEEPVENEVINITATIRNIGEGDADSFTVQFWEDEIGTGIQIGDDIIIPELLVNDSVNVTVNYTTSLGEKEIFVVADAYDELIEETKDNNIASRLLNIQFWHYAAGTMNDSLRITDASSGLLFEWPSSEAVGSNIFVTDPSAEINWQELQALGRTVSNDSSITDFELLDQQLGSGIYSDSINNTYTLNNNVRETNTYTIFGREIENVPVFNSTDNDNFKTGILWDFSDGGGNYDGSQDVLFVTTLNRNQQGFSGIVDFEIRIPATLREYQSVDNDYVVFYTELI